MHAHLRHGKDRDGGREDGEADDIRVPGQDVEHPQAVCFWLELKWIFSLFPRWNFTYAVQKIIHVVSSNEKKILI